MLNKICVNERYKVCENIFKTFELNHISYAVIKGAVLSKMAFGDIYHRKSGDIDILVNRKDIDMIEQIMLENNFIQGHMTDDGLIPFTRKELLFQTSMSHQMAPFIKRTSNPLCPYVNVDINFDIIWGESKVKCDMEYVLSYTRKIEVCNMMVNKLSPEMEFVSLCLHHYKDMNSLYMLSKGSLKQSLFDDIYNYLKNIKLDKDKLVEICSYLNITEYVYYCIYYTNELFHEGLCEVFLLLLYTEKSKNILNTFGLADDEIKEWNISFHDRLYNIDINNYLNTHLSENDLGKIRLNRILMN